MTKQEAALLIQAMRDVEHRFFPNKNLEIWIESPDVASADILALVNAGSRGFRPSQGRRTF